MNAIAPGFIETDITAPLSEEQRKNVRAQVPLDRFAGPRRSGPPGALPRGTGSFLPSRASASMFDGGMVMA